MAHGIGRAGALAGTVKIDANVLRADDDVQYRAICMTGHEEFAEGRLGQGAFNFSHHNIDITKK